MKNCFKVICKNPFSFLLLVLGFFNALLVFYPGSMSVDSYDQFGQAVRNRYYDWHPPAMAWLWRQLFWLRKGPQPMLFFHLGMFWTGLFLVWKTLVEKKSWCRVLVPLIGFFPPLLGIIGTIWKDVGVGAAVLLVVGLWSSLRNHFKLRIGLIILFLIYATWIRHQSLAMTAPFLVAIPWLPQFFARIQPNQSKVYRTFNSILLLILVVTSNKVFETVFLKTEPTYLVSSLYLFDLSKIEQETNLDLVPEPFKTAKYSKEKVFQRINERYAGTLIFPADAPYRLNPDAGARAELKKRWLVNIAKHFRPLLKFKWFHFRSTMAIGFSPMYIHHFYMPRDFGGGIAAMEPMRQYWFKVVETWARATPLFRGGFYMLVSFVGLLISLFIKGENNLLPRLCFVSVLSYSLSFFPVGGGCDFRYTWPLIVVTLIGLVIFLANIRIPKSDTIAKIFKFIS